MAVTRIKSNQMIDEAVINAKIADFTIQGGKLANALTYGSDLTVSGNLTVNGTTTTIDTTTMTIEDPILLLASTATGTGAVDLGILGERGSETNVFSGWDESENEFVLAEVSNADSSTTVSITDYAPLHIGALNADDGITAVGTVQGGTLTDGTATITSGAIASVTTIGASGNVTGGNLITAGLASVTGNVTGGNLVTAGLASVTGNVTGGNLVTAGVADVTGNITGGNLVTGAQVVATGNITGGNLITAGLASVTGNVTGGNLVTAGLASVTGNVTGGNLITAGVADVTGNIAGGNLTTGGNVNLDGNVTVGNVVTITNTRDFDGANIDASGTLDVVGATTLGGTFTITDGELIPSNVFTVNADGNVVVNKITDGTATLLSGALSGATSGAFSTTVTATGNVAGGNLTTAGAVAATGTITGGSLTDGTATISSGAVSGVTTLAMTGALSGATSGAFSTTVTATGNVAGGNLTTAGAVAATGTVTGGNLTTAGTLNVDGATTLGALTIDASSTVSMGSNKITLVADPVGSQDAATKNYVDNALSSGFTISDSSTTQVIAQGDTLTFAGTANEVEVTVSATDTVTIGLPNDVTIANDLTVTGDLTVNGTTTTVNTATTTIVDPILQLGRGADNAALESSDGKDRGISMYYYSGSEKVAYVGFDDPTGEFRFIPDATISDEAVTGSLGTANLGKVRVDNIDIDLNTVETTAGNLILGAAAGSHVKLETGDSLVIADIADTHLVYSNSGELEGGVDLTWDGTELALLNLAVASSGYITDGVATLQSGALSGVTTLAIGGALTGATSIAASATITGGNLTTAGTLGVDGATTLNGILTITDGELIPSDVFTVNADGNVVANRITDGTAVIDSGAVSGVTTLAMTGALSGATSGVFSTTLGVTGTATVGNVSTAGTVTATGAVTGGSLTDGTATLDEGALSGVTTIGASGTITGGSLTDGTATVSSGAVSGVTTLAMTGALTGATSIAASDTITGGNLTTAGTLNADGATTLNGTLTVTDGELIPSNVFTVNADGNVVANRITDGTAVIDSGAVSGVTTLAMTGAFSGATTISSSDEATLASATVSDLTATRVTFAGTSGALVDNADLTYTTGTSTLAVTNVDATSVAAGNLTATGNDITGSNGEVTINEAGADIDFRVESSSNANMLTVDAGSNTVLVGTATPTTGAGFKVGTTDSMILPVGTTSDRPTGAPGMIRYNSSTDQVEGWDVSESTFKALGVPAFTVIASENFAGDDSTVAFTLSDSQTTASCIVSINGVVQLPTTAYSVSTTTLTFTEAPATGDVIEVRKITTTTTVASLSNGDNSVTIECGASAVAITGDVVITGDLTFSGANFLGTYAHSAVYTVTSGNETSNTGATLAINAATLGFDLTEASYYQVFINRVLLRPAEFSVDLTNGTITFAADVVAENDEVEAVFLST
jgi:hypothetical protein